MKNHRTGIRRKITLLICSVVLVVVIIGISAGYFLGARLLRQTTGNAHLKMAQTLADNIIEMIEEEIEQIRTYLSNTAWIDAVKKSNSEYGQMDSEDIRNWFREMDKKWAGVGKDSLLVREYLEKAASRDLQELLTLDSDMVEIFLTDGFGGIVASSGKTSDFYQGDEEWWQEAFAGGKGKTYIGEVEFDESSSSWAIPFALPIRDESGALIGISKAVVSLAYFFEPLERFRKGKTGHAILHDKEGNILFHPGLAPMTAVCCEDEGPQRLAQTRWGIIRNFRLHEGDIFIACDKVDHPLLRERNIAWHVCVDQSVQEVYAPLRALFNQSIIVAGGLIIILIPVGFIFGGIFVRPVKELKNAAERISKGDLEYKIDVKSNDELEDFAGSFREMVSNIKGKQREILQEKNYTENIISSMTDALVVLNLDRTIKSVNDAGLDLLGYRKQELIGRPVDILFAEEPFRQKIFDSLGSREMLRSFDTVYKTKSGERIPVSFSMSAMRSKEGRVMAVLCVARDIRQRRALIADLEKSKAKLEALSRDLEKKVRERTKDLAQTQQATLNIMEDVQESKQDLEKANLQLKKAKSEIESFSRGIEAMVESMAEGVIMIDRQGNPVVLNPQAKMMLGFGLNESVTSVALNNKMKLIGLTQAVEECRVKGSLVVKEVIIPQEKSVILHCEVSPVKGAQGKLLGIVAILRDITREKEIDNMKTEFISTVSHELRTPLSITKEGVSLVIDGIPGKINPKQGKILSTARDNIDRLARIINSLLDISKIEAGKVELKRNLIDIVALAKQAADNFAPKIKTKQLALKTNFLKKKILVYADSDRIMQVFVNLLSNALKFTEKGSIEISIQEKDDRIECAVSDTGIGISRHDLPKVFGKFQQFGRIAGGGEKGTGLGLSIAKGIIDLHHGIIRVESKKGKGSKFIFTLPKYNAELLLKEYVNNGIKGAIKTGSKMSLIRISIARMAELKRNFSNGEIDAILIEIEKVLKASLRREGDNALKISNEVVVILSNCDKENSLRVKNRFEQLLKDFTEKKKLSGRVNLKFASVTYPDEGKTAQELIEKKQ